MAEYADCGPIEPVDDEAIEWLSLSDYERDDKGRPLDPLLEALIELMETDADGPSVA